MTRPADTHAAEAQYSERHPHEPEIPPVLDDEGRCRICGLLIKLDEALAALSRMEQRADEAFDYGRASVLEEIVCSVCGSNHDRDESAACEGCVPVTFEEWVVAEQQRREQLEAALTQVVRIFGPSICNSRSG